MHRTHATARSRRRPWRLAAAGLLLVLAAPCGAQLRLPGGGLPQLPALPAPGTLGPPGRPAEAGVPLQALRRQGVLGLLRQHPGVLEADPAGEPVVRGELVLVSPSPTLLQAALGLGFGLLREEALADLGERLVVMAPPPGLGTAQALQRLRALDPEAGIDFNHVYTGSGAAAGDAATRIDATAAAEAPAAGRIGLVDGGVDGRHPVLRAAALRVFGCGTTPPPSAHGTAVASLLVGNGGAFRGASPGRMLYAADVVCGLPTGGSAERIAQALAWMARERVPVVNLSLVGPANRLLERSVQALAARGHLVVAAVGNDGPNAPPLYPAAYPGVIGVTGVDARRRALPEAARGAHVAFAAPGADMAVASPDGGGFNPARGTSFAAPLVAGLLAARLAAPDTAAAAQAVAALAAEALDLGERGPDPVYGRGLVGEGLRIAPDKARAAAP